MKFQKLLEGFKGPSKHALTDKFFNKEFDELHIDDFLIKVDRNWKSTPPHGHVDLIKLQYATIEKIHENIRPKHNIKFGPTKKDKFEYSNFSIYIDLPVDESAAQQNINIAFKIGWVGPHDKSIEWAGKDERFIVQLKTYIPINSNGGVLTSQQTIKTVDFDDGSHVTGWKINDALQEIKDEWLDKYPKYRIAMNNYNANRGAWH